MRHLLFLKPLILFLMLSGVAGCVSTPKFLPGGSDTAYFADMVILNGIPNGIFSLSQEEAIRRNGSIAIEHDESGRISKATVLTESKLEDNQLRFFSVKYDASGNSSLSILSENGTAMATLSSPSPDRIDFDDLLFEGIYTKPAELFIPFSTVNRTDKTDIYPKAHIHHAELTRNSSGAITKIMFRDRENEAVYDSGSIAGYEYQRDSYGRIVHVRFLDKHEKIKSDKTGTAQCRITYDGPNLILFENLDNNGKPVFGLQGWASCRFRYDKNGNMIEKEYLDTNGKPVARKNSGCAKAKFHYNKFGQITEVFFYGADENPIFSPLFFGLGVRYAYDDQGRRNKTWVLPAEYSEAPEEIIFNEDGNPEEMRGSFHARFGDEKSPYHYKTKFDERGRRLITVFYNQREQRMLNAKNIAGNRRIYDDTNRILTEYFVDADLKKEAKTEDGSRTRIRFNEYFNPVSIQYMAWNGTPVTNSKGYSEERIETNESGDIIRREYFDAEGKRTNDRSGASIIVNTFDDKGNLIKIRYFGADAKPCVLQSGIAGQDSIFDEHGNETERTFIGLDGKPAAHSGYLYAAEKHLYDEYGRKIETRFFDAKGNPVKNSENTAVYRYTYGKNGQVVRKEFFGLENGDDSCYNCEGVYHIRETYAENGELLMIECFDKEGKYANNQSGYARIEFSINDDSALKASYYTADGTLGTSRTIPRK